MHGLEGIMQHIYETQNTQNIIAKILHRQTDTHTNTHTDTQTHTHTHTPRPILKVLFFCENAEARLKTALK